MKTPTAAKRASVVLPAYDACRHRDAWQWAMGRQRRPTGNNGTGITATAQVFDALTALKALLLGGFGLGTRHRVTALPFGKAATAPATPTPTSATVTATATTTTNPFHLSNPIEALWRRVTAPPMPNKVAVVGVHGWFPGWLIRNTVTGKPTGTSQKFAEKMEQGVRQYFLEQHNFNLPPSAISSIALEGHGRVEDRVDKLYSQIMKPETGYAKILKEADTIMVAAHSQGSPVSVLLFARLVREGFIDLDRQRVCILLMAGISHGPFPHMKSSLVVKYEADAARQLFDFNDPNANITKRYHAAISQVLNAGIRICCVGSWYDQVVPLYSAVLHAFNHPSIYRAIHIEGSDYNPDFLSHLVVFALRLRNAGLSDRGLLVYLSEFLAGNVYGFGTQGHSTVYEETETYAVATAWCFGEPIPYNYTKMKQYIADYDSATKPKCCNPYDPFDASLATKPKSDSLLPPNRPRVTDPPPPFVPSRDNPISDMLITADPIFHTQFAAPPGKLNPYWLPWILAQITSDPHVYANAHLRPHLDEVITLLDEWEPTGKALRELQYRLEPLRSRL